MKSLVKDNAMSMGSRLLKSTVGYTLVGLLGPGVALVLTPLYTRAVGVAGYGTVDLLQTLAHMTYTVALWGIPTTLASRYFGQRDDTQQRQLVSSALVVGMLIALLIMVLAWVGAPWLARMSQRPELVDLVRMQSLSLPFGVYYGAVLALLRLRSERTRVMWMTVVLVAVTALSRIVLVLWWQWGVPGMIVAASLTNVVNALIIAVVAWPWVWGRIDRRDLGDVWRLGAPLVPASVAVWVLLYQDRWFLAGRVDALTQGEYALAVLLTSLLALGIEPFKQAWMPLALQITAVQRSRFLDTSVRVYLWGALSLGALVSLATPELLWIMSGHQSALLPQLVALLTVLPISGGVVTIVGMVVTIHARPAVMGWSTAVAALANTVLNLWLIGWLGVVGAAVATALAALIIPFMVWRGGRTLEAVSYAWGRVCIAIVWYIAVVGWVVMGVYPWWVRIGAVSVFVVGLWGTRLVTWSEVRSWWDVNNG